MPAVLTHWRLPEDESEFFDYLEGMGSVVACPTEGQVGQLALEPIKRYVERVDPLDLLFAPETFVLQAIRDARTKPGGSISYVKPWDAPLLRCRRGRLTVDGALAQTHLNAYWTYLDADEHKIYEKDPEFIAWGKRVFAWVRRKTPEKVEMNGYYYRATKRVKQAVDAGRLRPTR